MHWLNGTKAGVLLCHKGCSGVLVFLQGRRSLYNNFCDRVLSLLSLQPSFVTQLTQSIHRRNAAGPRLSFCRNSYKYTLKACQEEALPMQGIMPESCQRLPVICVSAFQLVYTQLMQSVVHCLDDAGACLERAAHISACTQHQGLRS